MNESFTSLTQGISQTIGSMRKEIPETIQAFNALSKTALAPGVLSALDKELIATAISVANRCDACIGFHVRSLVRLGASRAQLMEMLGVCAYMGGGPSLMYAAETVRAFDEFSASAATPA